MRAWRQWWEINSTSSIRTICLTAASISSMTTTNTSAEIITITIDNWKTLDTFTNQSNGAAECVPAPVKCVPVCISHAQAELQAIKNAADSVCSH